MAYAYRLRSTVLMLLLLLGVSSQLHAAPDFAELYARLTPAVVTVATATVERDTQQVSTGLGSGFLVEGDKILTAAHVVDGATRVRVRFSDGHQSGAEVLTSIASSDIALLQLETIHPNPTYAKLADSDATRIGEPVFVIGSPFGISKTLSVGHLSGRMDRGFHAGNIPIEFLQTDTAINTGNSGGPMFNQNGEVIGVVSFILSKGGGFDGIGFATSSNTAERALLGNPGVLAGFEGLLLDDVTAGLLNYPQAGLLVQRVVRDSVADRIGLLAGSVPAKIDGIDMLLGGDVIFEINGLVCSSPHDFQSLEENAAGLIDEESLFSVKIYRDGEVIDLAANKDNKPMIERIAK